MRTNHIKILFFSCIALPMLVATFVFSHSIKCRSQETVDHLDLIIQARMEWEKAQINKVERQQLYTLPLYQCDDKSPIYPIAQDYIKTYIRRFRKERSEVSNIMSLHLRDLVNKSMLIVTPMDIPIYKGNQTEKINYAGVFIIDDCYFLVTDAVASFLRPISPDTLVTFSRSYIEYDLDDDHKEATTGYIDKGGFRHYPF